MFAGVRHSWNQTSTAKKAAAVTAVGLAAWYLTRPKTRSSGGGGLSPGLSTAVTNPTTTKEDERARKVAMAAAAAGMSAPPPSLLSMPAAKPDVEALLTESERHALYAKNQLLLAKNGGADALKELEDVTADAEQHAEQVRDLARLPLT